MLKCNLQEVLQPAAPVSRRHPKPWNTEQPRGKKQETLFQLLYLIRLKESTTLANTMETMLQQLDQDVDRRS